MKLSRKILVISVISAILALASAGTWYILDHRRVTHLNLSLEDFAFDPGAWPVVGKGQAPSGRNGRGPGRTAAWRNGSPGQAEEQDAASALRFYTGLGLGVVQFSMNLGNQDVRWAKDTSTRRSRVFTGLTYTLLPNLVLGFEYRALALGEPLFALDLGGQRFELDDPFQDHLFDLKLRYDL